MEIIRRTNEHGIVTLTRVEKRLTRKLACGRTDRYVYGQWWTKFGGWTAYPEWHLIK